MTVEDVPEAAAALSQWAVGNGVSTPGFLFSSAPVREAAKRLREALPGQISYAVKANACPPMLAEVMGLVDIFNVTNLVHLECLIDRGVAPDRILWAHPVTPAHVLRSVADTGVRRVVVDDMTGLDAVARIIGPSARVTIRLRPPDVGGSNRSIVRFGCSRENVHTLALDAARRGLEVEALSFFVGVAGKSLGTAAPYELAVEYVAELVEELAQRGIEITTVNVGGGFPALWSRFHTDNPGFFDCIASILRRRVPQLLVICEPGRFLSEASMTLMSRVIADRGQKGQRMVHIDASGYAGLFETTFVTPGVDALTVVPGIITTDRPDERSAAYVLGPVMDSFDVPGREIELPRLAAGDVVLMPGVGAYNYGYSTTTEGLTAPGVTVVPTDLDSSYRLIGSLRG